MSFLYWNNGRFKSGLKKRLRRRLHWRFGYQEAPPPPIQGDQPSWHSVLRGVLLCSFAKSFLTSWCLFWKVGTQTVRILPDPSLPKQHKADVTGGRLPPSLGKYKQQLWPGPPTFPLDLPHLFTVKMLGPHSIGTCSPRSWLRATLPLQHLIPPPPDPSQLFTSPGLFASQKHLLPI